MSGLLIRLWSALRGSPVRIEQPSSLPSPDRSDFLALSSGLPIGLAVIHTPAQVRACRGPRPGNWPYTWHFRTEVRALDRPLWIVQFAIVAWDGESWVLPPDSSRYNCALLTGPDFQEWYHCPVGKVEPDRPAVDPENWAGSYTYRSFKQKWLYVGADARGRRFRGEGVVELLADE